jgi:hypothetical protein
LPEFVNTDSKKTKKPLTYGGGGVIITDMKNLKLTIYTLAAAALIAAAALVFPAWGAHTETVSGFAFAVSAIALVWAECCYYTLHPERLDLFMAVITISASYAAVNVIVSAAFIVCMVKDYTAIAPYWQIVIESLLAMGVGGHVIMTFTEHLNTAKRDELNELYREIYGEDYKD